MKPIAFAAAVGMIAGCVTALAAERSITQKGKTFSQTDLTIKKGDTLRFVNDDNITHNIFSTSSGNTFNIGAQAPGVTTPVKFANTGEVSDAVRHSSAHADGGEGHRIIGRRPSAGSRKAQWRSGLWLSR